MWKDLNRTVLELVMTAIVLLPPGAALANDGMPPSIFELVQEGQNVKVVLEVADPGDPGIDASYRLNRNGDAESAVVFDNKMFDAADAVSESEPTCRWWEPTSTWCIDSPELCADCDDNGYPECFGECVVDEETQKAACEVDVEALCNSGVMTCDDDCDGDGANDCYGWCRTVYYFEMVDTCVPPGETTYELFYRFSDSEEWFDIWKGTSSIDVTDSGEACDAEQEQRDDGAGNGQNNDDTADNSVDAGCSAVPGASAHALRELLSLLL